MAVQVSDNTNSPGSFASGFTLGMLVGAVGYYLFATDRGIKLRKTLLKEWEGAKEELAQKGTISDTNVTFREFVGELLNKFSSMSPAAQNLIRSNGLIADASKRSARPIQRPKKDTGKRFKGI